MVLWFAVMFAVAFGSGIINKINSEKQSTVGEEIEKEEGIRMNE